MVTLAFAQAGQVLVQKNPDQLTGGEEGLGLNSDPLPDFFVGVLNAKNLYWLALGYAVVVFLVVRYAVSSSPGHVWQAIRENERRVEVIGLRPFGFKLIAFVLASFLCTLGGIVWLLVLGTGASPQVTTANFTLTLLVMVVIGGAGTRYGALLGGFLYTLLDQRLGALAGSSQVQDLPTIIRKPLSEPLFILGTLFILLVFFVPGGLAGLGRRVRVAAPLGRPGGDAMKIAWERHGAGPPLLLIQGLGYARWGWEPVVEPLARSFDVILFDNRGIGESDAPAGPYTAAQMAGDALQVLDEAGVERAHVVGTSLGGMVAQELALAHPERVDKLVLACTTPGGRGVVPDARADREAAAERGEPARVRRERARSRSEHRDRRADPAPPRGDRAAARGVVGAGRGRDGLRRARPHRGDRRPDADPARHRGRGRRLSQHGAARAPDPRRTRRALPGRRPPLLLGAARPLRRSRRGVPPVSGSLTLGRWIRDRARTTPARVAIDCRGVETTYAELDERSDRLAAGLLERASCPATASRR